jgi:predicted cupin superfamily sugar epimerase
MPDRDTRLTAAAVAQLLQLSPHPEGGYFRETFRATEQVQRTSGVASPGERRTAGTAIYFLLPGGTFSAWHRVRSDEAWHHYAGVPVELHTIDLAGIHRVILLGRDLAAGQRPQHVVPADWLQAARPVAAPHGELPDYALCGCTVCPGFEFSDFELPARLALRAKFPALAAIIDELTRE